MEITQQFLNDLKEKCGASHCAMIRVSDIVLDPGLRQNCELNYCGEYGRTWVCPPHCGPIEECIQKVKKYKEGIIIQTISPLEDSYDFEGMEEAGRYFKDVLVKAVHAVKEAARDQKDDREMLVLSAGGCHRCETCAVKTNEPCRHPNEAFPSLESHGIFVSDLAAKAGLNYINGQNTVTYFGAVLMG
ncbi:MAG TPA: DUF2284 domain-containing protein [Candidatus Scybalocola faecavium]|nr:DUF2284 domain-containing protein [Candidatus Scybalocola faecavium]